MENPEGVLNLLDEFAKLKSKEIPSDLEEYLSYVAASGDPVYQWSLIKSLYRQKLINVITEFYEMFPVVEIPRCPNVDPFNYETMKNSLLKRLDSFTSAPFTIQRISELLTTPRKQYNRVDKFMRAIEKNIWVVSTREPGIRETVNPQDTSGSLVNGVSPRVCVTVKHPKRVKSIEERIKSGHPQLIDDEEEEEEEEEEVDEYEQMEEETNTEILPNNETDDSSLQCTSVKDLIDKYENGTIFSNSEEKTEFEEKSSQLEATTNSIPVSSDTPSSTENCLITSDAPSHSEVPSELATEIPTEAISETPSESVSEITPESLSQIPEVSPTKGATTEAEPMEKAELDIEMPTVNKKEESVVTADSSTDLSCQENENKVEEKSEVSTSDSTSDMCIEELHPAVESSTTSSPELLKQENDSLAMMVETSTPEITTEGIENFQAGIEPSSDSTFTTEAKEANSESTNSL